jgi:hypothetical protein
MRASATERRKQVLCSKGPSEFERAGACSATSTLGAFLPTEYNLIASRASPAEAMQIVPQHYMLYRNRHNVIVDM